MSPKASPTPTPEPMRVRSLVSVVMVTPHPPLTGPTTLSTGMRTSVRKTSLKWDAPVACRNGRTSMPGVVMSTKK